MAHHFTPEQILDFLFPPEPDGDDDDDDENGVCEASNSFDPNALIGPSGYGSSNFVADAGAALPYTIDFENSPTATAPAQSVTITEQLDPNLNWSTFQLTAIGWGDTILSIPAGSQFYQTTVSMTYDGQTFDVDVEAGIHTSTGQIYATFQSINPLTDLPPSVLAGFLPPEDGTGRGKGYISYSVDPKSGLATGTQIRSVAQITFDENSPIATDQVSDTDPSQGTDPTKQAPVTIDNVAPTSSVATLPATTTASIFTVSWSGADDANGSGVAGYNVYVSDDGGSWTLWQQDTTATSASFTGIGGHTYAFYSQAIDNVGNVEPPHASADASTTIVLPLNVAASSGAANYTAGAAGEAVDPGLNLTDTGSSPDLSATVAIVAGAQTGDTLNFSSQNGITGAYAAGVLTLTGGGTGAAAVANYLAALQSVTFSTTSSSLATRTVLFSVSDGTELTSATTKRISVLAPAEVTGIYVKSSAWSTQFLDYLADPPSGAALGSATYGYALQTGDRQLTDLPWSNIDTITVTFSEPVYVDPNEAGLALFGANQPPTMIYDGPSSNVLTSVATWALASPLTANSMIFALPATAVTDTRGAELDGAWTNNSSASASNGSTFPSGAGVAGSGDFDFDFNLLPGDANQDGYVLGSDATALRPLLATNTTSATYSPYYDLAGSGTILGSDATTIRNQLGKSVPAEPTLNDSLASPSLTIGESGSINVAPALGTQYMYLAATSGSSADLPAQVSAAASVAQPLLAEITEAPNVDSEISASPSGAAPNEALSIVSVSLAANTSSISSAFQANVAQSAAINQIGDASIQPSRSVNRSLLAQSSVSTRDEGHAKVSHESRGDGGVVASESRARAARLVALDRVLAESDFFEL